LAHAGLGQKPDDGFLYAGRIVREPAMENPTLIVLNDRNDLDDQLFSTFSRYRNLLRQPLVLEQAEGLFAEWARPANHGMQPPEYLPQ
jgi:type I site-specific restriction-modification system R (restriction) subunit